MNDPTDLNPWEAIAAEAEAAGEAVPEATGVEPALDEPTAPDAIENPPQGVPFEWAGRTWRLRPQFDLRVVVALKAGDFGRALGLLIGREQTDALLALDTDEPFTDDVLKAMVERVARSNGTSLPE